MPNLLDTKVVILLMMWMLLNVQKIVRNLRKIDLLKTAPIMGGYSSVVYGEIS